MGRTQLGVVEEQSGFGGSFLLEGDGCVLSFTFLGDLEVADLSTDLDVSDFQARQSVSETSSYLPEAEEIPDLLLRGRT